MKKKAVCVLIFAVLCGNCFLFADKVKETLDQRTGNITLVFEDGKQTAIESVLSDMELALTGYHIYARSHYTLSHADPDTPSKHRSVALWAGNMGYFGYIIGGTCGETQLFFYKEVPGERNLRPEVDRDSVTYLGTVPSGKTQHAQMIQKIYTDWIKPMNAEISELSTKNIELGPSAGETSLHAAFNKDGDFAWEWLLYVDGGEVVSMIRDYNSPPSAGIDFFIDGKDVYNTPTTDDFYTDTDTRNLYIWEDGRKLRNKLGRAEKSILIVINEKQYEYTGNDLKALKAFLYFDPPTR